MRHFIIAGAQRSGTTWLYSLLDRHKDVIMAKPLRPEPKYFLREDTNYTQYIRLFDAPEKFKGILGEKSTSYIEFPNIAKKIINTLPDKSLKFIFVLRDPKIRAVSNILFSQDNGYESGTVSQAIQSNLERVKSNHIRVHKGVSVSPNCYLERGLYYQQIKPFVDVVGIENVFVTLSEKIQNNANEVERMLRFLQLDNLGNIDFKTKVNASNISSNEQWEQLPENLKESVNQYYQATYDDLIKHFKLDIEQYWQLSLG